MTAAGSSASITRTLRSTRVKMQALADIGTYIRQKKQIFRRQQLPSPIFDTIIYDWNVGQITEEKVGGLAPHFQIRTLKFIHHPTSSYLVSCFYNGETICIPIPKSDHVYVLARLKTLEAEEDHLFSDITIHISGENDGYFIGAQPKDVFYEEKDTAQKYKKIHEQMIQQACVRFESLIKNHPSDEDLIVNLVDIGCGQAPELLIECIKRFIEMIKLLPHRDRIKFRAVGFDKGPGYITYCQEYCKKHNIQFDIQFVQKDALHIDEIFKKTDENLNEPKDGDSREQKFQKLEHSTPNIYTFAFSAGSMTCHTATDSFDCLLKFQKAWPFIDCFLLCGATNFLFNKWMHEGAGFTKIFHQNNSDYESLIVLLRVFLEEMLHNFLDTLHAHPKLLDLSRNPCPLAVLQELRNHPEQIAAIETIDLSFCQIHDIKGLIDCLKFFPKLKRIKYNSDNPKLLHELNCLLPKDLPFDFFYTTNGELLLGSEDLLLQMNYRKEKSMKHNFVSQLINYLLARIHKLMGECSSDQQDLKAQLFACFQPLLESIPDLDFALLKCSQQASLNILVFVALSKYKTVLDVGIQKLLAQELDSNEMREIIDILIRLNIGAALKLFCQYYKPQLSSQLYYTAIDRNADNVIPVLAEQKVACPDEKQPNLISHAVKSKNPKLIKTIADLFPHLINQRQEQGRTPVHDLIKLNAGQQMKFDPVRLRTLVECKADLNIQDDDGNTAAHLVSVYRTGIIAILRETKADFTTVKNKAGFTPLELLFSEVFRETNEYHANQQWLWFLTTLRDNTCLTEFRVPEQPEPMALKDLLIRIAEHIKNMAEELKRLLLELGKKYHCHDELVKHIPTQTRQLQQ